MMNRTLKHSAGMRPHNLYGTFTEQTGRFCLPAAGIGKQNVRQTLGNY